MALHREMAFKKTRSQYLTDHPALHGQLCAMRPTSLEQRHGEGKGWDGKQHSLWQKCWKPCYRNSEMSTSKSVRSRIRTHYSTIVTDFDFHFLPWIVIFHRTVQPQHSFCVCSSWFAWKCSLVETDLSWSSVHNNLIWIIISVCNRAKTSGAAHSK